MSRDFSVGILTSYVALAAPMPEVRLSFAPVTREFAHLKACVTAKTIVALSVGVRLAEVDDAAVHDVVPEFYL